jgi:DNA-binding NarL/FixJ family response regulator
VVSIIPPYAEMPLIVEESGPDEALRAGMLESVPAGVEGLALALALGMSNVEIAERLFLSTKTVHHHVSAILRKLGVSRRGQAAAEVARPGLTSTN